MTDAAAGRQSARNWIGLLLAIPVIAVSIVFDQFGIGQYFLISLISVIALSIAVWENRSFHREIWFWITLFAFAGLHVFLVMFISEHKPLMNANIAHGPCNGAGFLAILDGLIITAVIRFPDWITSSLKWVFSDNQKGTTTQ